MPTVNKHINQIAQEIFGYTACSDAQLSIIHAFLKALKLSRKKMAKRQAILTVMATGGGKSATFLIPCLMEALHLIAIFPLKALSSDMLRRVESCGIHAVLAQGGEPCLEVENKWKNIPKDVPAMLLATPEYLEKHSEKLLDNCDGIILDEFHSYWEWGASFRPAMLKMLDHLRKVPFIYALTATANQHVKSLFTSEFIQFNRNILEFPCYRGELSFEYRLTLNPYISIRSLIYDMKEQGAVLVFCRTRIEAELFARRFVHEHPKKSCRYYHAGLHKRERKEVEKWYFDSPDGILFSTNAFGMGVDKGDIRLVIHTAPSASMLSRLQESGRAARDRNPGRAVSLISPQTVFLESQAHLFAHDPQQALLASMQNEKSEIPSEVRLPEDMAIFIQNLHGRKKIHILHEESRIQENIFSADIEIMLDNLESAGCIKYVRDKVKLITRFRKLMTSKQDAQ
jgi:ATP-dependent DNA helicase RecQ